MYGIRSPRLYKTILRGFSITGLEEGHIWAVFEISSYSKADGVTLKPTLHCKFLPHENYGHRALRNYGVPTGTFSLHYLWKTAVRITNKLYVCCW